MVDFGSILRGLRRANGYTQQQVADAVSVSKGMISAYETGIRQPSYEALLKLARLFKVSTDYLLGNSQTECGYSLEGLTPDQIESILRLIHEMKLANDLI